MFTYCHDVHFCINHLIKLHLFSLYKIDINFSGLVLCCTCENTSYMQLHYCILCIVFFCNVHYNLKGSWFPKKLLVFFHILKFVLINGNWPALYLLVFCRKDLCEARPKPKMSSHFQMKCPDKLSDIPHIVVRWSEQDEVHMAIRYEFIFSDEVLRFRYTPHAKLPVTADQLLPNLMSAMRAHSKQSQN